MGLNVVSCVAEKVKKDNNANTHMCRGWPFKLI